MRVSPNLSHDHNHSWKHDGDKLSLCWGWWLSRIRLRSALCPLSSRIYCSQTPQTSPCPSSISSCQILQVLLRNQQQPQSSFPSIAQTGLRLPCRTWQPRQSWIPASLPLQQPTWWGLELGSPWSLPPAPHKIWTLTVSATTNDGRDNSQVTLPNLTDTVSHAHNQEPSYKFSRLDWFILGAILMLYHCSSSASYTATTFKSGGLLQIAKYFVNSHRHGKPCPKSRAFTKVQRVWLIYPWSHSDVLSLSKFYSLHYKHFQIRTMTPNCQTLRVRPQIVRSFLICTGVTCSAISGYAFTNLTKKVNYTTVQHRNTYLRWGISRCIFFFFVLRILFGIFFDVLFCSYLYFILFHFWDSTLLRLVGFRDRMLFRQVGFALPSSRLLLCIATTASMAYQSAPWRGNYSNCFPCTTNSNMPFTRLSKFSSRIVKGRF